MPIVASTRLPAETARESAWCSSTCTATRVRGGVADVHIQRFVAPEPGLYAAASGVARRPR
jgi:hypothetical protein